VAVGVAGDAQAGEDGGAQCAALEVEVELGGGCPSGHIGD